MKLKKVIASSLAAVMVLSMAACGNEKTPDSTASSEATSSEVSSQATSSEASTEAPAAEDTITIQEEVR